MRPIKSTFLEQVKCHQWQSHRKGLPKRAWGLLPSVTPCPRKLRYYTSFIGGPWARTAENNPNLNGQIRTQFLPQFVDDWTPS